MNKLPTALELENTNCRLVFHLSEKGLPDCRVELQDKRTGLRLSSGLCEAEVHFGGLQRAEIQMDYVLTRADKVSPTRIVFGLAGNSSQTAFDLVVDLDGNEFTTTVPWDSIREGRQEFFRLFGVRPLPGLLSAGTPDTLVAPLRSGALIRMDRRRYPMKDRLLIYGQQCRWEDLPLLPVCAQYAEGKQGIAVIAEQGDCDTQYEIEIVEDGRAISGFSCRYRYLWPDPVDPIDRILRYVLLDELTANYSGVGRRLNRFVRETWRVSTLKEKCERSPELRYMAGATVFKTFHGVKDMDRPFGDGAFHCFQTFAETKGQLRQLKDAGIANACFQLVGWNLDGHDGHYPVRFPVEPRLGGEEGFKDLVRYGQDLGYQMQVHDDYSEGPRPDYRATIRTLWGDPLPRGIWAGGSNYLFNPMKLGEAEARRDMLRLRDLGVAGVFYLDAMCPPLEIDYDRFQGGPRRHHADGIAWILEQGRAVFGASGTENGFACAMRHADYLGDIPYHAVYEGLKSATPIQGLVDEWVPLWHLVFHGMLVHSTNDQPSPASIKLLEAAEIGGSPRADFSGAHPDPEGPMFAIQWDDRLLPAYKAKCDILIGLLGQNQFAFIDQHRRLGDECYRTAFSNGCVVEVDYKEKQLAVNGKRVAIPPVFDLNLPMRRTAIPH